MRIGVVGLGYWGKKVAREYRDLMKEGIIDELVLCDVLDENINEMKKECPECEFSKYYKEIMNNLDGVHICTPNATHFEIVNEFIKSGVNVLVEKPMTLKYTEARKLAYKAYNKNIVFAVGHIFRFNNAVRRLKELYEKGELGELYYAKLQWGALMNSPQGRDVVYDLAPHPFDILNFVIDDWPIKIFAIGKTYRRDEYEEVAYINAEFENNFIANIEVSWMYPDKVRRVEIMGSKKFARLEAVKQELYLYDLKDEKWKKLDIVPNNTIKDEITHFIKAIKNKITPVNDGFNAAENVRVLEACVKSIKSNKVINLEW